MKNKDTTRAAMRSERTMLAVRRDHHEALKAESARRKAAKVPRAKLIHVTDDALDQGLGIVITVKQNKRTKKGQTHAIDNC